MIREWIGAHRMHLVVASLVLTVAYGVLAVVDPPVALATSAGVLAICGALLLLVHVCRPRS